MHVVDILIPHFRDPKGLAMSIESIEQQDWHGKKRVIVVDDGSEPDVVSEVKDILAASPCDCLLIEHPENRGRPAARNTALQAVTAPYVAWLDAGDTWYPRKLGRQFRKLRAMEDSGEDISNVWVSCDYDWQENNKIRFVRQNLSNDLFADLIVGKHVRAYLWTLLAPTSAFRAVGLFDENLPRMQDLDYFLRFVLAGGNIVIPNNREGLCRYFKSDEGRKHKDVAHSAEVIFDKHGPAIRLRNLGGRVLWKNAHVASRFAANNGDHFAWIGYFAKAILSDPRYAAYRLKKRVFR